LLSGSREKATSSRMCRVRTPLSTTLLEWKAPQEKFKGRRIVAPGGINFAASQFVFAGYSGEPFSNRPFNLHRAACGALGVGEITAHGLRHSAATILLNHVGTDLREIQEFLRPQEYPHQRALHARWL
jgi:integrase